MVDELTTQHAVVALQYAKANIVTAQTDTDLALAGGNTITVMPKAGSVVGVAVNMSALLTAGSVTVEVHKDGTELAEEAGPVLTLTTAVQESYASVRRGAIKFTAGTGLGVSYSSSTDIEASNTLDLDAVLYIAFDND